MAPVNRRPPGTNGDRDSSARHDPLHPTLHIYKEDTHDEGLAYRERGRGPHPVGDRPGRGGWPITRIFAVADEAVGVPVAAELYGQMRAKPLAVDLPALWRRLGVAVRDDTVHFDDQAPLAAMPVT